MVAYYSTMLNTILAQRIRTLRNRQNRTLDEIARACGFTKSMLSKIETGRVSPTIAALSNIAKALGVPPASLLEDGPGKRVVFQAASERSETDFTPTDKGYRFFTFAQARHEKAMQLFLFKAEKGKVQPKSLQHSGEEFVYVLKGSMKYRVGSVEYTLTPGDSLYFDAEEQHDLEPISAEVEYLGVFVNPPAPAKPSVGKKSK